MSLFSGYDFFVSLFILLLPAVILGISQKPLAWYRDLVNLYFIVRVFEQETRQFFFLAAYVIFSVYLVKIYVFLKRKFVKDHYLYGHCVFFALLPLLISRAGGYPGISGYGFLGMSYICFRVVQIVIEIHDGIITEVDERQIIRFLLFFPALSSGPVDRSRRFGADAVRSWKRSEYLELLGEGMYKLVLGMFYKFVCAGTAHMILETMFAGRYAPLFLIGRAYVYGLYLFSDFAGYSHMAVGTAYVLGIRLPDNFNRPFMSVDMKEFWNRWHITVSHWFRDFVFTRFLLDSIRKKKYRNRMSAAVAGLVMNMALMGLWHGTQTHYLAYGIYHGVLLAVTEVYQKKSSFYKRNRERLLYRAASWLVTLNCVMFGFLIFSGYLGEVYDVFIEKMT